MNADDNGSDAVPRLATVEEIYLVAVGLPAEERGSYLEEVCADDDQWQRVAAMLMEDSGAESLSRDPDRKPVPPEAPLAAGPGTLIGPYKILQRIGEGGFGIVFMAEQEKPISRRVALKIIKPGMDTRQVIARFEAERQAVAMMDHPNIAKVLDAGATATGRPYFVMELVRGTPITTFCNDHKLGIEERLRLFVDVCSAVNHAHQKGVIHRDLKPSNIMVSLNGDDAAPKIIDFGIAKAVEQKLTDKTLFTRMDQFIGSPLYISPEQATLGGMDVDTRSDIYSLGVILYELLVGKPPFDPSTLMSAGYEEMRRIIRDQDPPKPSHRVTSLQEGEREGIGAAREMDAARLPGLLRGDLDWIVMKAIEKNRARRYETANAFGLDIRRHLNNEPVSAAAPSGWYKFGKFVLRNKGRFAALMTIALTMLAGTVVSLWQAAAARRALANAVAMRMLADEKARETTAALQERDALLYKILVDRVRDLRKARPRQPGWRALSFENIKQAGALVTAARSMPDLRGEAVASLRGLDVEGGNLEFDIAGDFCSVDLSRSEKLFAVAAAEAVPGAKDFRSEPQVRTTLRVWNVTTGELVRDPHGGELSRGLRPAPAGTAKVPLGRPVCRIAPGEGYLVYGFPRHRLQVLPLGNDKPDVRLPERDSDADSVAFDRSGRLLAVSWIDGMAGVYDLETGATKLEFPADPSPASGVFANLIALSDDGMWLATLDGGGREISVRPVDGGPSQTYGAVAPLIGHLSFNPADNRELAVSRADGTTELWDRVSGQMQQLRPSSDFSFIFQNAFADGGRLLATCSANGALRLWDVEERNPILLVDVSGRDLISLAIGERSNYLATAWTRKLGNGNRLPAPECRPRIYKLDPGRACQVLGGTNWNCPPLFFGAGGNTLFTGSLEGEVCVWRGGRDGFTAAGKLKVPIRQPADALAYHQGAGILAVSKLESARSSDAGRVIELFRDGAKVPFKKLRIHAAAIHSIDIHPDGRWMLSGDRSGVIWATSLPGVQDASAGEVAGEARSRHEMSGTIVCARFLPGGNGTRFLAASSTDRGGQLGLFDIESGRTGPILELGVRLTSVAPDPERDRVMVGLVDGSLKCFRISDLSLIRASRGAMHDGEMTALAISPDGRFLASGGGDRVPKLWDAGTLELLFSFPACEAAISGIAISPDQLWLAIACRGKPIVVWDLERIGKTLADLGLGEGLPR